MGVHQVVEGLPSGGLAGSELVGERRADDRLGEDVGEVDRVVDRLALGELARGQGATDRDGGEHHHDAERELGDDPAYLERRLAQDLAVRRRDRAPADVLAPVSGVSSAPLSGGRRGAGGLEVSGRIRGHWTRRRPSHHRGGRRRRPSGARCRPAAVAAARVGAAVVAGVVVRPVVRAASAAAAAGRAGTGVVVAAPVAVAAAVVVRVVGGPVVRAVPTAVVGGVVGGVLLGGRRAGRRGAGRVVARHLVAGPGPGPTGRTRRCPSARAPPGSARRRCRRRRGRCASCSPGCS